MRNVGGSVGTSTVSTMLSRRSQFHQSVLAEHTRSLQFADTADSLARRQAGRCACGPDRRS
ncbi:MAG TPA: hypothetical protein VL967_12065 [Terracidiphilus sp.]|nr:hypothetical protein [Terracidiphilus sp.]